MRRFYKSVEVSADLGILLDGRPVRTPAKALLTVPQAALAEAIAQEWNAQGERIDPRAMPLTGLANAAIDRVAPDRTGFAASLAKYAETELLCYRADSPPELVARQQSVWDPILDWAARRYDVSFTLVTGIMHQPQPDAMRARLAQAIGMKSAFALAAFNPLVTISGSLVIPLGLAEGERDADAAFDAAHLDELWQAEQWGEDDFALEARAAHKSDFLAAARFLELVEGGAAST